MNKILVLGAGLVAGPLVRYLLDHGFEITVASRTAAKAQKLVDGYSKGRALEFNVDDKDELRRLVSQTDVAVSLLPAARHIDVARMCLDLDKHMVTTSYVSPAMRALDEQAKKKQLLLLNEMGVDPGMDHMSAMSVIHHEEQLGGKLIGFSSWCGGLPAPEANDNPFGYKFSWSPKGVLIAARNAALYERAGRVIEIDADQLFANPAIVEIPGLGAFEGYPNRDSVAYKEIYGFHASVKDMFRGTLRYPGHCKLYTGLIGLGLLEDGPKHDFRNQTYLGLMEELFGRPIHQALPAKLGLEPQDSPLEALSYIGMLDDRPIKIPSGSLMDLLAVLMSETLTYKPGERDMLIMRHDISFSYEQGNRKECVTAIMLDYGIPDGDSSMARTVSLPAAIGVRMLMDGRLKERGVHVPVIPAIYTPILKELQELGISFRETRQLL